MKISRREMIKTTAISAAALAITRTEAFDLDGKKDFGDYYLHSLYKPCRAETNFSSRDMIVEGQIPKELEGSLYYNSGSNEFAPLGAHHWFDGDGMIHHFRMSNGAVSYQNRWIDTSRRKSQRRRKRTLRKGAGDLFGKRGMIDLLRGDFSKMDSGNTTLTVFNNQLIASWYFGAGRPYLIDPQTLETKGDKLSFSNGIIKKLSAHSKVHPITKELIGFSYTPTPNPLVQGHDCLNLYRVQADGKKYSSIKINLPGPRHIHDLAIAIDEKNDKKSYAIVFDLPTKSPLGDPRKDATRIGVVSLHEFSNNNVQWFEVPAGFILHVADSFARGSKVVLRGTRNNAAHLPNDLEVPTIPNSPQAKVNTRFKMHLWEWEMDLLTGRVKEHAFHGSGKKNDLLSMLEFPIPVTEGYGIRANSIFASSLAPEELLRMNEVMRLKDGKKAVLYKTDDSSSVGEAIYIPNKQKKDRGWLCFLEHSPESVSLNVFSFSLDSVSSFHREAKITLPEWNIPVAFHGAWMNT